MRGKLYLTPASRSACAQARQAYKPIEGHSQQDVIEKVINSLEGGGGTTNLIQIRVELNPSSARSVT